MSVLHPGRTLIEKLLRMNNFSQASDSERDAKGWPRIGRQFYYGSTPAPTFADVLNRVRENRGLLTLP